MPARGLFVQGGVDDPRCSAVVPMSLSSTASIYSLGDLMWADFWWRFPELRFSLTEGDIGWIPYFLQRASTSRLVIPAGRRTTFPDGSGPSDVSGSV